MNESCCDIDHNQTLEEEDSKAELKFVSTPPLNESIVQASLSQRSATNGKKVSFNPKYRLRNLKTNVGESSQVMSFESKLVENVHEHFSIGYAVWGVMTCLHLDITVQLLVIDFTF